LPPYCGEVFDFVIGYDKKANIGKPNLDDKSIRFPILQNSFLRKRKDLMVSSLVAIVSRI
jgi:hypothetical protein